VLRYKCFPDSVKGLGILPEEYEDGVEDAKHGNLSKTDTKAKNSSRGPNSNGISKENTKILSHGTSKLNHEPTLNRKSTRVSTNLSADKQKVSKS
jgi:hypothetical protein